MTRRLLDVIGYIAIGLIWVGAALYVALYIPEQSRIDIKWIAFVAFTAVTFGYPIRWYRRHWKNQRLWGVLAGLLAVHVAVYGAALWMSGKVPLILFPFVMFAEWAIMYPALDRVVRPRPKGDNPKRTAEAVLKRG